METKVQIPEGVTAKIDGPVLTATGPKGELTRTFRYPKVSMKISGNELKVSSPADDRRTKAVVFTWGAHTRNIFTGVTKGWNASMKAVYSHFPMKINVEDNKLVIQNFLGERKPRLAKIPENVTVEVKKDDITVTGLDKELVGQTCSRIEICSRITKRDRRIFQDGIYVTQKTVAAEE